MMGRGDLGEGFEVRYPSAFIIFGMGSTERFEDKPHGHRLRLGFANTAVYLDVTVGPHANSSSSLFSVLAYGDNNETNAFPDELGLIGQRACEL
jgi:hypothetical protein